GDALFCECFGSGMQVLSRHTLFLSLPSCHIESLSESFPKLPAMLSRTAAFLPRRSAGSGIIITYTGAGLSR
ncbi:MAG: hypothetical protein ACYC9O_02240, partial [Candidatus Latescibacterota bacterium]